MNYAIYNILMQGLDALEAEFYGRQMVNCEIEILKFEQEINDAKGLVILQFEENKKVIPKNKIVFLK